MDFNINKIKLIVGLGNPDEEYADTYHNIGHQFIDFLKSYRLPATSYRLQATGYRLIKTDTYMNESGSFVLKALKKSDVKHAELLIIQDDSDIEIGKYKFSFGRGSAGHKGIESIIKSLKTKNFWRLRIGIAKPAAAKKIKAEELVLKKINKTNKEILNAVFEKIKNELY